MKFDANIRKCVGFVGALRVDNSLNLFGTCFFIQNEIENVPHPFGFVVTARHVIEGIKGLGVENVYIRVSTEEGKLVLMETFIENWISHSDPSVDLALHPFNSTTEWKFDILQFPIKYFATHKLITDWEIGPGDEVAIVGFFWYHHGSQKNIPIVRVGNIASMPEEKVVAKDHLMDAFLIETKSLGGLSGSPVFLNPGASRVVKGKYSPYNAGEQLFPLIGIIQGHYEASLFEQKKDTLELKEILKTNSGIAIVTPIEKLLEIFSQDPYRTLLTFISSNWNRKGDEVFNQEILSNPRHIFNSRVWNID